MTLFLLKSCPRCGGDLMATQEPHFGSYVKCIQCARYWDKRNRARQQGVPGVPAWLLEGEPEPIGR